MIHHLRRLRRTPAIRDMLRETHLRLDQFIAPLFISATLKSKQPIRTMPGQFQFSLQDLAEEVEILSRLGVKAVLLFGIPEHKDVEASAALKEDGIVQQAARLIRALNPDLTIIADVCLCEYTDHGHCGILQGNAIDTYRTLQHLAAQAVSLAEAGVDWVAPSSMTDGMVAAIRHALDGAGFFDVAILSYAVKYSSCLYGPFREAAQGAPKFGDRKAYQMDPANRGEGLREAGIDVAEGADILMIKPAMNYLDIIATIKQHFPQIPLCAYQVSGEYSMIKAAASQGIVNEQQAMWEALLGIKRAGADLIISYFTKDIAQIYNISAFI